MRDQALFRLRTAAFTALAACHLLLTASGQACFEIEPVTPAERGAATHLALGLIEESLHLPCCAKGVADSPGAVAVYGFRPFGVSDVTFGAVWAAVSLRDAKYALCFSYQRLAALSYVEETCVLSHGLRSGKLWCQPALRFGTVKFEGEYLDWMVLADLTLRALLRDNLRTYVGMQNPFALGLVKTGGACPTSVTLGLGCLVSPGLAWGMEINKQSGHQISIATGVEWSLAGGLLLRTGLKTYPREFSLGIGLRMAKTIVDVAASMNLNLGPTREFGATYVWN